MIRMYNPKRFWELRNDHQIKNGEDPLPPYNPLGEDFAAKLQGVNTRIVLSAIARGCGVELTFDEFLLAPTPATLAKTIASAPR